MRVLLTTDTIGGVWTYTKELTEGLLEQSHSVSLISFGRLPSAGQRAWCSDTRSRFGDKFHYTPSDLPLEWMDPNQSAYSDGELLLLETLQSFPADVLHSNQFCFGRLPVSVPKLVTAHSDVLSWAKACLPQGLEASLWLDTYQALVQGGLSGADAVVAPTHWMLAALAERFELPPRSSVILNGRDLPSLPLPLLRKLQAVTIGRLWDPAKGLSLLSQITSPFPIYVAGETQHASQLAPSDLGQAQLLGPLDDKSLLELLHASSIYLATSEYEPFGLAPLEAALCGCAVVARDLPSLREVWGDAALYFEDAPSLEALLRQLASTAALLADAQSRSLTHARSLNRHRMTESYVELYQDLASSRPNVHPVPAEVQSDVA